MALAGGWLPGTAGRLVDIQVDAHPGTARRFRFSAEVDRRGVFLRLGRLGAYGCTEPRRGAWSFQREASGFDAQAWRLHLAVGKASA